MVQGKTSHPGPKQTNSEEQEVMVPCLHLKYFTKYIAL